MNRMTPNWTWILNSQKYSIDYTKCIPRGSKFHPFRSMTNRFRDTRSSKIRVHWVTPSETWTLNSQKYLIYTKYLSLRPNFWSIFSMISRFRDTTCTRSAKSGNVPNDPKMNLTTSKSKVLYIHCILTPEAQILVRFTVHIRNAAFVTPHRETPVIWEKLTTIILNITSWEQVLLQWVLWTITG